MDYNKEKCAIDKLKDKEVSTEDAMKIVNEKQEYMIEKYGFVCHLVPHNDFTDCHTHGLVENKSHMDLQITLPMDRNNMMGIIHNVVNLINQGNTFKDKDIVYHKVISDGYPIKFKTFKQSNREVLRLLICDENGVLPDDEKCDSRYKKQMIYDTYYDYKNMI